jgi:hypothetical protein
MTRLKSFLDAERKTQASRAAEADSPLFRVSPVVWQSARKRGEWTVFSGILLLSARQAAEEAG